jgi:hypothetical protein
MRRALPLLAGRLLGARLQLACASATSLMSAAERPAPSALEVPGRADDLLLRRDQPSSCVPAPAAIAWLCASEYSSLNGFTSRKKISLRDSVDCFARGRRARARSRR